MALRLFPDFRSRESKSGEYRRDVVSAVRASSSRLPCIGGPAMLLGLSVVLVTLARVLPEEAPRFLYVLTLVWLEGILGWADDLAKSRGQGLGEHLRLAVHALIALLAAGGYVALGFAGNAGFWGQLGSAVAVAVAFLYLVLSAGFSDGVDGLTASLMALPALGFAALGVLWGSRALGLSAAATLGVAAGMLLLNQPSNWTRTSGVPRRARAYVGDSGALLAGAAVALLAITSGTIALLPLFALGFLAEGASVFVQTGLLTPLYRRGLRLHRFRSATTFVPHTEFPLPFLATPLHYHLNLIGLRPLQVEGFFWTWQVPALFLGAGAALLGSAWPRAACWVAGLLLLLVPLVALALLKPLFLSQQGAEGEPCLLLCRGRPLRLASVRFYRPLERLEGVHLPEAQRLLLNRPLGRYDALCLAAEAAAASGREDLAERLLGRVPSLNLLLRPDAALLAARQAQRQGTLADLLERWRQALRPVYQEGRLELVREALGQRAQARCWPDLARALGADGAASTPPTFPAAVT